MRKVVALLILLLVSYALSAQIVIQGSVRDEEGVAIAGVVVSLQQQGKTLSYGTTGKEGRYRLHSRGLGNLGVNYGVKLFLQVFLDYGFHLALKVLTEWLLAVSFVVVIVDFEVVKLLADD